MRHLCFKYSSCLWLPRKHVLAGMISFSPVSPSLRYSSAQFGEQNWSPFSQEKVLIISLQIFSHCGPAAMKVSVFHLCPILKTVSIHTLFLTSPPQGSQPLCQCARSILPLEATWTAPKLGCQWGLWFATVPYISSSVPWSFNSTADLLILYTEQLLTGWRHWMGKGGSPAAQSHEDTQSIKYLLQIPLTAIC